MLVRGFTRLGFSVLTGRYKRMRAIYRLPLSSRDCERLRSHSLISSCNSVFLVSIVSVASRRLSSAIRPATKSGRPDFLGFSKSPTAVPLWLSKQSLYVCERCDPYLRERLGV